MAIKDPVVIDSPLSREFTRDGITVEVRIYRLEDSKWTLEVVDATGTSHVWDDEFETDHAARTEFLRTVDTEGMREFCASNGDQS